jgi:DNA polymerase III subunit epsilon
MTTYERWTEVPENLKTKTGIKQAGKRRRPKQQPVAQIDTRYKRRGGVYDLYDLNECLDKRPVTDKQRATFAQTRGKTTCKRCARCAVKTNADGLCADCHEAIERDRNRRSEVMRWAQELLSGPFVVLDTETTGLTPGKIVDLAIVDGLTHDILFDSLVNPQEPIPAEASAVHHITDSMVADAPIFADILPEVERILSGKPCVIYNVDFDRAFLRAEGLDVDRFQFTCAMRQFARFYGEYIEYFHDYKFQPLHSACAYFDIELHGAHRAVNDARATANLIHAMAKGVEHHEKSQN